jgi:hypothetical protein
MKHALLALAAAAALAIPAAASAEATSSTFTQHVAVTNTTADPCVGKPAGSAVFDGFLQQTLHVSTDAAGGQHVENIVDNHLQGTSKAGVRYVLASGGTTFEENDTSGGATELTFIEHSHFIATGPDTPADDLNLEIVNHVTVNANGEVTSSTFELHDVCQ